MNYRVSGDLIFQGDKQIGALRNWCCGVDFRPLESDCVFSILKVKKDEHKAVLECVTEIMQLDLDKLSGHFNYRHPEHRMHSFSEIKSWFDEGSYL